MTTCGNASRKKPLIRTVTSIRGRPSSAGGTGLRPAPRRDASAPSGRTPDQLLIRPAATFVLGDTNAEAAEVAREVRRAQVSPATALRFIEQLWNTELPDFDVDGPLPDFDPVVSDTLISQGRASVRQFAKNPVALPPSGGPGPPTAG